MHSRYEVGIEQYLLTVSVEANLTLEIGHHDRAPERDPLPDRARHERRRARRRPASRPTCRRCGRSPPRSRDLKAGLADLAAAMHTAARLSGIEEAAFARDNVLPAMAAVRAAADTLEGLVADDLWSLPTYQEMLYIL